MAHDDRRSGWSGWPGPPAVRPASAWVQQCVPMADIRAHLPVTAELIDYAVPTARGPSTTCWPTCTTRPPRSGRWPACRSAPTRASCSPCSPASSTPAGPSRWAPSRATRRCASRGPGRGRLAAVLRRQRRVDRARPPGLGPGRPGRPHRAAPGPGDRDAAGPAGRADRPGVHRRRQARLRRLLARAGAPGAATVGCCSPTTCCGRARSWTPPSDANAVALRAFNDVVAADDRVEVAVLPAFDGLTIARRR